MKDNKSKEKVLIIVKGGVVQSLYGSSDSIEVDILDFDNEAFENQVVEEKELEMRCNGLIALV